MFYVFQIELIDRVDDIYRNTSWDEEFKGYGVQIHQVTLITGGIILLSFHLFSSTSLEQMSLTVLGPVYT